MEIVKHGCSKFSINFNFRYLLNFPKTKQKIPIIFPTQAHLKPNCKFRWLNHLVQMWGVPLNTFLLQIQKKKFMVFNFLIGYTSS